MRPRAAKQLVTLFLMVFNGLRFGGKAYLAHFSPGPLFLAPLMIPLEIVGTFAKTFALAVRLFANMLAGHIMLTVFGGFVVSLAAAGGGLSLLSIAPMLGIIGVSALEFLVAFLQAYVFAILTCIYLNDALHLHKH